MTTLSPETLAAFADGELDGEALRVAEAAVAADPALQAQLAAHRALKGRLAAHFAPIAEMSVPDHLIRAVTGENDTKVIDFAAAVASKRPVRPAAPRFAWFGPALAASLAVVLVGYGVSRRSASDYAVGDVAAALDRQLVATQAQDAPVRVLLSFRDGEGKFCRGFSSEDQSGVACRDGRGWKFAKLLHGGKAGGGEYRQAGSADAEVMTAIQDMAEGPALDAEGEMKARDGNWRN